MLRIKKIPFIGGNSQSYYFNFKSKKAGSINECPVRIFRSAIDPNNILPPADAGWSEITSQGSIDLIKNQDTNPLSYSVTSNTLTYYNGKKMALQSDSQPAVRDDYAGKVAGSASINPHSAKWAVTASLHSPSQFTSEFSQVNYDNILVQDTNKVGKDGQIHGYIPQQLFSFDLISIVERKYGTIPASDTAGKVQWLKDNIKSWKIKWQGYGANPSGNKAYLDVFNRYGSNKWSLNEIFHSNSMSNTMNIPSTINFTSDYWGTVGNEIGVDGFIHFIAYTDPASTTSDTIVAITNHGIIKYQIIENTTRNGISTVIGVTTNSIALNVAIFGQVAGDNIIKYGDSVAKTAESGTTESIIKITNHGYTINSYVCINNSTRGGAKAKCIVTDIDTLTLVSTINSPNAITGQTSGDSITIFINKATFTAESTVIPSTIYTDYISIDVQLKEQTNYDIYVPENPRRDDGLATAITVQKTFAPVTDDFVGKVSGSTVECPHIAYSGGGGTGQPTTLITPNDTKYEVGISYGNISALDGSISSVSGKVNGGISQQLFSFNLIRIFEDTYGTIPRSTDAVSKVAWLKSNISKLTVNWYGYGSCPQYDDSGTLKTNRASLQAWYDNTRWIGAATFNTSITPALITGTIGYYGSDSAKLVDNNGVVNYIAFTDPSDGVTASTIYTDYISLTMEFTNNIYPSAETFMNSTTTDVVPKSAAFMVEVDMTNIANTMYSGSNTNLKSNCKYIDASMWATGQGLNVGLPTNGSDICLWNGTDWDDKRSNTTGDIIKVTTLRNDYNTPNRISLSNKIYALIVSTYPTDGSTASTVNLDYFEARADFTRTPDIIKNFPIINVPATLNFFKERIFKTI